jgi:DNA-binding beta-propeller fold protein YncE
MTTRILRGRAGLMAAALALALVAVLAPNAAGAVAGAVVQKAGPAGCIGETNLGGLCVDGHDLSSASGIGVSPDGLNVYVASGFSNAISVFDRDPATGALTQKTGTAGCISNTGSGGACVDGNAIISPTDLVVSPDGRNVYASGSAGSVALVFDRDPASGELTQKAGTAGCISETGDGGLCVDGVALEGAQGIAISPDGAQVYVAANTSDAVAVLDRDPATGALTQKAGAAGCVSDTALPACVDAVGMNGPTELTVSPDGGTVYVVSANSDGLVGLARNPQTGVLAPVDPAVGCVRQAAVEGCAVGVGILNPFSVIVSGDGRNVYVAALGGAMLVFDRTPATGAIAQKAGPAGCISEDGTGGACQDGVGLLQARAIAASPDGDSVYAAGSGPGGIAAFDRDPATGALTQKAGRDACTSTDGTGGACRIGRGLLGGGGVAVAPDGANVYTAAFGDDAVGVFDRRQAPLCAPGASSVGHGQATVLTLSCLGRGAPVTSVEVASPPGSGTLGAVSDRTRVTYTPPAGFSGATFFTFTATSGFGTSRPATFDLTVQAAVQGPAGPAGPAGPRGPAGPAGATQLGFATAKKALAVKRGRVVGVQYLTTKAGRLTGTLRRGNRVVRRISQKAKRGLNSAPLRTARTLRPGRYTLALQLRAGTQRATATVRVTVRR